MNAQLEEQPSALTDTSHGSIVQIILEKVRPTHREADKSDLQALSALLKFYLTLNSEQDFDPFLCTVLIAELEKNITEQLDAVLHHPKFQSLESAWRSLLLLVENTPFEQNIKIELLNLSREDLLEDLDDAPEITKSGLYKQVYSSEYGQFGGEPYGVMMGNYYLTPRNPDLRLMKKISSIAAMSHTPFIAAAAPEFFDIESMQHLPSIIDIQDIYTAPHFNKWKQFRNTEDARYLGLVIPRFLLRRAYKVEDEKLIGYGINYQEINCTDADHSLWGNSAFLFILRLIDSFARFRWCPHIIGPTGGGQVNELLHTSYPALNNLEGTLATEVMITDRREYELTEEGFIALTLRRGDNNKAAFYSAASIQSERHYGHSAEDKEKNTNFKLGGQLPYLFIINRIAHYLKVIQRENIGTWKEKADVERGLNQWIKQYVSDQENPSVEIRNRRPLRKAKVEVQPVEGEPGWYRAAVQVRPHFKYMGADFTLSLVGKLEVTSDVQKT